MGQQRKTLTPERSPAHKWGWELRTRRDNAGLSLAALGTLTRFDRSYLARAERGDQFPSQDAAEACDRALNAGGELTRQWHQANQEHRQGAPVANATGAPAPADAAELPPFNEHASCPKCLSDAVRVTYHPAPAGGHPCHAPASPAAGEHLCRTCERCGHGWSEATAHTPTAHRPRLHLVKNQDRPPVPEATTYSKSM
jgi:transcriptional regulator with XRE-family HTH domain